MTRISDIMNGFLYKQTKTLQDIDFFNKVMQFDDDPTSVASSESSFIFAGPPVLNDGSVITKAGSTIPIIRYLHPIGAVQNFVLNEGKQIIPFKELGSRLTRQAAGGGQYNASLGRVLSKAGNAHFACYQWLHYFLIEVLGNTTATIELSQLPGAVGERHWTNMESEVFLIPFGLLVITGSAGGELIQVEYLERCLIQGGGQSKTAGQVIVSENLSLSITRAIPFITSSGENLLNPETFKLATVKPFVIPSPGLTQKELVSASKESVSASKESVSASAA